MSIDWRCRKPGTSISHTNGSPASTLKSASSFLQTWLNKHTCVFTTGTCAQQITSNIEIAFVHVRTCTCLVHACHSFRPG